MSAIVALDDPRALDRSVTGGKGVNLAALVAAGFPVPGGFVVATDAYTAFAATLAEHVGPVVAGLRYDDAAALDADCARIREAITGASLPDDVRSELASAYESLGGDYVAVRSSGTAEDLAEASFAGMHDTYLDIRGADAVADAVKRCWASLWTARATSYRHTQGFDHGQASLAVVVQVMVDADVAGVMFTANPLTGHTRETVVNASYGLGEAVVSGLVTPDEFVIDSDSGKPKRSTVGEKAREIVRDPDAASGTLEREVDESRREQASLTDRELGRLCVLGRRVQQHYDGMPQDIEWAKAGDELFLLQARDVTGVELSWDEDIDAWQWLRDEEDYVWTRAYSDEYWTGAITPLFYSIRAREFSGCHERAQRIFGHDDLAEMRNWKYSKGEAYFNATYEKEFVPRSLPPFLRAPGVLAKTPSTWWDEILDAPFSWADYAKIYARIYVGAPKMGPTKWIEMVYDYIENRPDVNGYTPEELELMSDKAIRRHLDERMDFFVEFVAFFWGGFFIFAPGQLMLVADLLGRWYDGDNPQAFTDLITGLPKQTITLKENEELWQLSERIRHDEQLRRTFDEHPGEAFFEHAPEDFREAYAQFVHDHGHRGHADRDFWFLRRAEAPIQDYNALKTMLSVSGAPSPADQEAEMRRRREVATEEIIANIRGKSLGAAKAEAFKLLLEHTHAFLTVRDDERHYIDRLTWSKKVALKEINRRCLERGVLDAEDDYFFLSLEELFEALAGHANPRLLRAKIAGRRRNFDRFDQRQIVPPKYILRDQPAELDVADEESDGASLRGVGTSRGEATGRARVLHSMTEIGTIENGDILICNSTDPGWTPVFLAIGGLVLETGGMLAHGSCLSREYGLPAVQVANATTLIPDGATVTVNGETGEVTIVDSEPALA